VLDYDVILAEKVKMRIVGEPVPDSTPFSLPYCRKRKYCSCITDVDTL
jgi:hypothetical protein